MSSNNTNEHDDTYPMKTWLMDYDPDSDFEEQYLEYDEY